jgi:hypothetical protein
MHPEPSTTMPAVPGRPARGERAASGLQGKAGFDYLNACNDTAGHPALENSSLSSYQAFNLTLLGRKVGKHIDVAASIYNILKKKYFDPGQAGGSIRQHSAGWQKFSDQAHG